MHIGLNLYESYLSFGPILEQTRYSYNFTGADGEESSQLGLHANECDMSSVGYGLLGSIR